MKTLQVRRQTCFFGFWGGTVPLTSSSGATTQTTKGTNIQLNLPVLCLEHHKTARCNNAQTHTHRANLNMCVCDYNAEAV